MDIVPLLDHPTAIVGTTGSGKTYAAKGAVEELLRGGRRVIIIDPTGAWFGLRAGADGETDGGFPVTIFGGEHADVPVSPDAETGKALALALATRDVQAIIDTSEMTGGEKNRFLTPFLEHLYALNKAALHLIVDEADEIAAQRLADGEQRLFGAFDKIVRRGRIKGFRPLMITQRPAVIHKNVLSQIGTLIAMKLTSPQDRKAIEDWVKGNADVDQARELMQTLPKLSRGEGWVWAPADDALMRMTFPPIRTFDSSRTPEIGEIVTAPALSAVDVEELRESLIFAPSDEAEKVKATPTAEEIKAAERRGYERGYKMGAADEWERGTSAIRAEIEVIAQDASAISRRLKSLFQVVGKSPDDASIVSHIKPTRTKASKNAVKTADLAADPLLNAALQVWPAKMTWAGLAAMCGRKARGGHYNTTKKRLLDAGLVREENNQVIVTAPPDVPVGVSPASLLEANLPQPAQKMFIEIRRSPGVTIAVLANRLGMKPVGGHWNTGMSILRRNGLIVTQGDGLFIADGLERM